MKKENYIFIFVCFIYLFATNIQAQNNVIDQVVAIVGNKVILKSDIENQYYQSLIQGVKEEEMDVKCTILEEMLFQKLLVYQAKVDSVEITDKEVDSELDRRLKYFVNQIGSVEKLEEYFKKSYSKIREDLREIVQEQLLAETMQKKIIGDIKITPGEVTAFYKKIPPDSIPIVPEVVEVAHIVKKPQISKEEKELARNKLEELRNRIIKGESFKSLAVLYSEDPVSARKGGEVGFVSRGELYPEVEMVVFNMKDQELSPIIESKAGYHLIQMIERKGERVNFRHILITPKVSNEALLQCGKFLDSLRLEIIKGTITFEKAAQLYSDDETKNNEGIIINPETGDSRFELQKLDPSILYAIEKLKVGEISTPVLMKLSNNQQAYRIVKLRKRIESHKANLSHDYQLLQTYALVDKQNRILKKWIEKKIPNVYIHVVPEYKSCLFKFNWFN